MADMGAIAGLAAMLALVVLLVQGRWPASVLFPVWACGFYLSGVVGQADFLGSFTNPALVTLLLLMMVSLVFDRTAAVESLAGWLLKGSEMSARWRLVSVATGLSAFMNNTAVVSVLLSAVTRQRRWSPSRLLIPLSFASILGGVTTLVGTSTNLVVNSFVIQGGLPAIGMFTPALVGVPVALACLLVMLLSGRLLPGHGAGAVTAAESSYFLEAHVAPQSLLIGRSIEDNRLRHLDGLFLVEIVRGGHLISPVAPDERLQAGDILLFAGESAKFHRLNGFDGLEVFGRRSDDLLRSNLVEVVISSHSDLPGRTLRDVDFRTMFNAGVVAIRRGERQLSGQLGRIPLKVGDGLLLAVGPDFAQHRNIDRHFHVLGDAVHRPRLGGMQSLAALGAFGLVVALATAGALSLFSGLILLLGAFLALGWLTPADMRRRFPFELLLVVGAALVISQGLDRTGTARLMADGVRAVFDGLGPYGALLGVYLMTVLLTEMVTNNAAAALAFPVAVATAAGLGVSPVPFYMVVLYGASACFLMPFGYQTHLMVMTPGRYKVGDYLRAGWPVSLVYGLVVLVLVPVFFPF
ncbi:MAG: SLC13 family permease [Burkholderiaceae bacterium]